MSHAQSDAHLVITIPFDFMVGKTMFPAGGYTIDSLQGHTFRLASRASYEFVVMKTRPLLTNSNRGSRGLQFVNDGHHYRLCQMNMDSATTQELKAPPARSGQLVWISESDVSHRQPKIIRTGRSY